MAFLQDKKARKVKISNYSNSLFDKRDAEVLRRMNVEGEMCWYCQWKRAMITARWRHQHEGAETGRQVWLQCLRSVFVQRVWVLSWDAQSECRVRTKGPNEGSEQMDAAWITYGWQCRHLSASPIAEATVFSGVINYWLIMTVMEIMRYLTREKLFRRFLSNCLHDFQFIFLQHFSAHTGIFVTLMNAWGE